MDYRKYGFLWSVDYHATRMGKKLSGYKFSTVTDIEYDEADLYKKQDFSRGGMSTIDNSVRYILCTDIDCWRLAKVNMGWQATLLNASFKRVVLRLDNDLKKKYPDEKPMMCTVFENFVIQKTPSWEEMQSYVNSTEVEIVDHFGKPFRFANELDEQRTIANNWEFIFPPHYELVEQQLNLGDSGRLDMLAKDHERKCFEVIELKNVRPPRDVLAQTLEYMGAIQQMYANGAPVSGLILAPEDDPRLRVALTQVPAVSFKTYKLAVAVC